MSEYNEEPEYRGEGPLVWPWVLAAILAIILVGLIWWAAARPVTYAQPARPPAPAPAPGQLGAAPFGQPRGGSDRERMPDINIHLLSLRAPWSLLPGGAP